MRHRALLSLTFTLVACDQRADVGDIPGEMLPGSLTSAESFCRRVVDPLCDSNLDCCTDRSETYSSKASCTTDQVAECMAEISDAVAVRTGKVVFDEAGTTTIIQSIRQSADTCVPRDHHFGFPLRGTLAEGADCSFTTEDSSMGLACLPELRCFAGVKEGDVYRGSCQRAGRIGDSCSRVSGMQSCGAGASCGLTGTCVALVPDGGACTNSDNCSSKRCTDFVNSMGVCRPARSDTPSTADFCFGHPDGAQNGTNSDPRSPACDGGSSHWDGNPSFERCSSNWYCADAEYRIECDIADRNTGAASCACSRNTISGASFSSTGYCGADALTRVRAANEACGWSLPM